MEAPIIHYAPRTKRSYDIIYKIISYEIGDPYPVIVDITFGRGRFYRRIRESQHLVGSWIIGVDITRWEWEVEPDEFYQMDAEEFTRKVIQGKIKLHMQPSMIVVDPPWNHLKRGRLPLKTGISNMPYHITGTNPYRLLMAGCRLAAHYNATMVYRFMEPLSNTTILIRHIVEIMGKLGSVYYGIIYPSHCRYLVS